MDKFYNLIIYVTICLLILLIMYSKFINLNIFESFTTNSFPAGKCIECSDNSYVNAEKNGCIECSDNSYVNDSKTGCNECHPGQHLNNDKNGCDNNEGYQYYGNMGINDFYCDTDYYYDGNQCIKCDSSSESTYCNGGNNKFNKGTKMLKAGYGTNSIGNVIECTFNTYNQGDKTYRLGDVVFRNNIECNECISSQIGENDCPPGNLFVGCGGDNEGWCSRAAYDSIMGI